MSTGTLDPSRCALLFFDMLNGHVKKRDPATQTRYAPVIAAATSLLRAARAHRMMIAYPHANHRADNATTAHTLRDADSAMRPIDPRLPPDYKPVVAGGSWEAQVIDELAPAPEDY